MTCVLAILERGHVLMACDSLVSDGDQARILATPKFERIGSALVGWAGVGGHAQAAWRWLRAHPPTLRNLRDGSLASGLRNEFNRARIECQSGMLIAVGGALFEVDGAFCCSEYSDRFCAIGSGSDLALGSLSATEGLPAKERARMALEAAERFCVSVRGPMHFQRIPCAARSRR